METLEAAIKSYEAGLTREAVAYLYARGFTEATIRTARLGVVADPIPAHERYRGWLAIPYLTLGNVVRVRFRCMAPHDHQEAHGSGKYGQPSGETLLTYGVDSIHEAEDEIHVTEGELDRLTLIQAGLPAIGFPGASSFRSHHGRMLAGFNKVYVWGDPDQAGAEFTTKILNRLPRSGRGVKLRGGDVNDTYLQGGAEAIHALAAAA